MARVYSSEEVGQILQQADILKHEGVSSEQLVEIAAEVGITEDALKRAEQKWLQQQVESQKLAEKRRKRRLGLKMHVIPYVIVSIFLVLLNIFTSPGYFWSVYPVLGWGLGVALHVVGVEGKGNK